MTRLLALCACLCLLSACATSSSVTAVPDHQARVTEDVSQDAAISETTQAEKEQDESENLPKQALNTELLSQLLVTNLASYRRDWPLAMENAISAARASQDPRVARLAALLALRQQRYQKAAEAAELWSTLAPDSSDAVVTKLLSQVGANNIQDALVSFAENRQDKSLDDHIKEVAGLLVRQNNGKAAIAISQHFVDQYPDSAQVLLSSSYVAESFEDNALAEQWLERSLTLRPDWDLAAQMKSSLLRRQGKSDELVTYIKAYIERNPKSVSMRMNYAAELSREQAYGEALELIQAVLVDDPENVSALNYAAALAGQLEQDGLAQDYYQQAIKLEPDNEDVRWALARYAAQEKEYLRAEKHYQKITSQENYLRAQLQVANMRYYTRSLKDAVNTLRALDPDTEAEYVDIAITRHYLLMQDKAYEEALGYINETLVYLPENIELKYARALVAAELNQVQVAEQDLRFVITAQPNHANALNALGYTLADQTDRYIEAKELIAKALELRPNDAHILDSMGWVLYREKEYEQALVYLRRAFEGETEAEVGAHLGEVLWESGQQVEAREIWRDAYKIDADNPLLNNTLERYGIDFKTQP